MFARVIVLAVIMVSTAMPQGVANAQETFRVTLVGTGTPTPS